MQARKIQVRGGDARNDIRDATERSNAAPSIYFVTGANPHYLAAEIAVELVLSAPQRWCRETLVIPALIDAALDSIAVWCTAPVALLQALHAPPPVLGGQTAFRDVLKAELREHSRTVVPRSLREAPSSRNYQTSRLSSQRT